MILLDTNSALVHLFPQHVATGDALLCDLVVDPIPRVTGDVIVADPPWYYEDMAAFLWVAQQVCRVGGRVILSTPKIGTRPRIGRDLQKLAKWIRCLGFVSETFERDAIEYQSPFFEKNALRAEGLSAYPENWRTADLLVLRLEKNTRVARPRPSEFRKHWQEAAFGTMRLRVLENKRGGFCDPSLRSLSVGDHPVSVSRRDPRKEKAKIWTSGNRVFDCAGAKLFLAIARALETDQCPAAAVEASIGRPLKPKELTRVDIAVRQLQQLAASENAEFRADQIRTPQDSVPHDAASSHSNKLDVRDLSSPWRFGAPPDVGIHVAVFVEPFLGFVLNGKKTVESRFSLTRRAPFKQVDVGDLVLLKKSGGPIVGSCRVAQTWFYVIDPASWTQIRREFAQAICAQDSTFWIERAHAKYATLLRIDDVHALPPVKFAKKDRRGWVVIRRSEAKTAFNLL
ncbi:MAG: ASCH domain-containing protein [Chthoniobacterales bacterium]|nr:ASCH domain-containing protein [Chthoniobacterales bacterium]